MRASEITGDRRPIGYWIKRLHQLTEQDFAAMLAEYGLVRRHWQVVNVIARQPSTPAEVDAELAPFLDAGEPTLLPLVEELRRRGWVEGDERVALSAEGERVYADLQDKVAASRARITDGVSVEEYRATVDVLARMSANLGG